MCATAAVRLQLCGSVAYISWSVLREVIVSSSVVLPTCVDE